MAGCDAQYVLAPGLGTGLGSRDEREALVEVALRLAGEGPVANRLVQQHTGLDRVQVTTLLNGLVEGGRPVRLGERKGVHYVLPA